MCGLVGVISDKLVKKHVDWFEQALYADALRGWDSTGMAIVKSPELTPFTYKKAMMASDFLDTRRYNKVIKNAYDSVALLGHNRAATQGKVQNSTAHPFTHGDITLTHNGTLYGHQYLHGGKGFDVDSEAVCYSISEVGIRDTIEEMVGAWALAYHDRSKKTFNLIRNDERPLFYAYVKDEDSMLYASEKTMLIWLAARNKIAIEEPISLPIDTLLSFDLEGDIREPSEEEIRSSVWYYGNSMGNSAGGSHGNANTSVSITIRPSEIGYADGQTIEFVATDVGSLYAGNHKHQVATWEGITITPPVGNNKHSSFETKVYSMPIDMFEEGAVYEGSISTIYEGQHTGNITLVMSAQSVKMVYSADEAEELFSDEDGVPEPVKDLSDIVDTVDTVELDGIYMHRDTALKILSHGCSYCSCNIKEEDMSEVILVQNYPLCPSCSRIWKR